MKRILILSLIIVLGPCIALGANAGPVTYWNGSIGNVIGSGEPPIQAPIKNLSLDVGDPVDFDDALAAGADYLRGMQADITEDNAGNGNPDVPDDPDDGGWDWIVNTSAPFSHTTSNSPTNLYGVTALGLYGAYLETSDATYFTAMQDAADRAVAAGTDSIRTGADMKFLMLFNDLYSSVVAPTTVYEDAAKAKYDGRITAYGGSATALAEYIRDARAGQGYENGIIAWDIGIYAVVAQMLYDRFGGTYDTDADDIAEVIWQDSFNDNPGYFDIVDDAGWDPTYANNNYWWYSLGITGLIDAFSASDTHTSELSGLLTILLDCQYTGGAISGSYGANPDDADWQSTAYAMITLGNYDKTTYQMQINWMGYWIGATQDASGGWVYGSGNHYPEIGGECSHGLYFTSNELTDVVVDDDFTSQTDVDAYNTAHGTHYVWGYDAFATIQEGMDAVSGSTIHVVAGTYYETLNITTAGLKIIGEDRATVIIDPTGLASNNSGIYVAADDVTLQSFTLNSTVTNSLPRYGIKVSDVDGCTIEDVTVTEVYRSGFDALGSSNLTLTNISSVDNGGHGLSLVDCNGVDVTDFTASGNGWQNVSVATWGHYTPLGTSDIVFSGTNSFGDLFQLEMGDYNNPGVPPAGDAIITYSTNILDGADVTVQASDFGYALHGEQDDSPDQVRVWFFSTLANAAIIPTMTPIGHWTGNAMYIESLTDGTQLYVTPGCSIQAATDAADAGDYINISDGTYIEQVHITTNDLHYVGSGVDLSIIQSPATLSEFFVTGSNNNYPVVFVDGATNVSISGLTIDGNGLGNANYRFIGLAFWNGDGSFTNAKVVNIMDTPFSGAQHGVGVYSYNDTGGPYTIVINSVLVDDFQKTAIALSGTGLTVDLDSVTTTGEGPTSVTAQNGIQIGPGVGGTLDDCTISGIAYTGGTWTATGLLPYGNIVATGIDIDQCQTSVYWIDGSGTFDGGTITNPLGDGFYAYNSSAKGSLPKAQPQPFSPVSSSGSKAAMSVTLSNTTITGTDAAYSWGVGAFSTSTDPVDFTITGCHIENWDDGIFAYDYGGPVNCSVINGNVILNNNTGITTSPSTNIGMTVYGNSFNNVVNAEDSTAGGAWDDGVSVGNCWSDFSSNSGYPTQYNVPGTAGSVDNYPTADCGLDLTPDEIVYHCASSGNFTFDANIGDAVVDMKVGAFKFEYDVNIAFVNVTTSLTGDVILQHQVVGSNPARTKDTLFVDIGFGSGQSLDGPATLFTVEMNGSSNFCTGTPIDMYYQLVKDINDNPITLTLPVPINLIADCEDPDVWVNAPAEDVHYNTAPVLDIGGYDNCDIDAVYYQVDGCGGTWNSIATGLTGTSYSNAAWTFPDFATISEGQHCIYFKITDDAARENSDQCDADSAWCFVKDTENPEPPENFTALPGHNKVLLSWDASPSGDVVRYQIQRVGWGDYPLYSPPEPPYPLNPTIGTTVYNDDGLDTTDTQGLENATRDIYYYSIFAFDAAGNYSASVNPPTPGTGTRDRSTSYWLGDIAGGLPPTHGDFDGFVYFADLDFFTLTYYLSTGDAGFDPHSDIGPTVAGSAGSGPGKAKGLPEPDGTIDINDLWVFATNFNTVDDSKLFKPVLVGQPVPNNTGLRIVQHHDGHDLRVELYLDNAANNVKLLEAEISFDRSMLVYDGADQMIRTSRRDIPVFFHATDRNNKVYITAGALGSGIAFEGSGLIADVRFSLLSEKPVNVSLTGVTLRDINGEEIVPNIIPTDDLNNSNDESSLTYDLSQNVPNPFNPTTTISYSVPTGTHVSVKVYNVMGQLVKTLVDDYRTAGRYKVTWNGKNDAGDDAASGVYFYRFETTEYSKTIKMSLVK